MAKHSRCLYCNVTSETKALRQETGKIGGLGHGFYYCSDVCHDEIVSYNTRVNHESNRFLLLILGASFSFSPFLLLVFVTPYPSIFSSLSVAVPLILVGMVIIRYPFATPETLKFWGIRKSVAVLKRIGVILILSGIAAGIAISTLK